MPDKASKWADLGPTLYQALRQRPTQDIVQLKKPEVHKHTNRPSKLVHKLDINCGSNVRLLYSHYLTHSVHLIHTQASSLHSIPILWKSLTKICLLHITCASTFLVLIQSRVGPMNSGVISVRPWPGGLWNSKRAILLPPLSQGIFRYFRVGSISTGQEKKIPSSPRFQAWGSFVLSTWFLILVMSMGLSTSSIRFGPMKVGHIHYNSNYKRIQVLSNPIPNHLESKT